MLLLGKFFGGRQRSKLAKQILCQNSFYFATLDPKSCFYEVLGVKANADDKEIKLAFLKMVKKYHPDQNRTDPNAEENFKIVAKAYEVLRDPVSRQVYDSSKSTGYSEDWAQNTNYGSSEYANTYYTNLRNRNKQPKDSEYNRTSKEETIKDEYSGMRDSIAKEKERIFNSMIFRLLLVGFVAIAVDLQLKTMNAKHKDFVATQRELVEASEKPNPESKEGNQNWTDYIQKRQGVLKKQQDEYHHTY